VAAGTPAGATWPLVAKDGPGPGSSRRGWKLTWTISWVAWRRITPWKNTDSWGRRRDLDQGVVVDERDIDSTDNLSVGVKDVCNSDVPAVLQISRSEIATG
jgi:hypothetical protein